MKNIDYRFINGCSDRYVINANGELFFKTKKGYSRMRTLIDHSGYEYTQLRVNGKKKTALIHRLVYQAFVGMVPSGLELDHIDGCKLNNSLSNLRLLTHKENCNNPSTKVKRASRIIHPIIDLSDGTIYKNARQAAEAVGCHINSVLQCCRGKRRSAGGHTFAFGERQA